LDNKQAKKIKEFIEIKDINKIDLKSEGLDNLRRVFDFLESKKDFIEVDLSTARGLAYYTGTVFEVFDRKGKLRAIAGGGRYDNMVELFGGNKCPAIGFGIGFATLSLLLEEKGLVPETEIGVDYYIAPMNEAVMKKAIEVGNILREKASVEIDLLRRSLKKQMDYANKTRAKNVIVIGEDEVKKGIVKIKDMGTGDEKEVKIKDL